MRQWWIECTNVNFKFVCIATRLNILYIHSEFHWKVPGDSITWNILTTLTGHEILSVIDSFMNEYLLFILQIIWNCMTLKAFSMLRSPMFSVSSWLLLSPVPTVCFIPSYLNQHSISFKTLLEFGKNLKITSKITLNIAWPMTIYFLHLYTIDINKYTYSRDTYHMLFHMIDSVNLRSFKIIIIMFKWDKSLVPNEISITRGICIHNLNLIKYRSHTLDLISSTWPSGQHRWPSRK